MFRSPASLRHDFEARVLITLETEYGPTARELAETSLRRPDQLDPFGVALTLDVPTVPKHAEEVAHRFAELAVDAVND